MRVWLENKWDDLRTSFWFLPTFLVAAAVALSLATIHLDRATPYYNWIATLGWTFTRGPEGSRAVLSTVAGSMMTIASVTFSITVVALQLASSQFGPRLLRNFMRDRGNQVAIGTFIATFTYCLLILRAVNGTEKEQFVPHISVTVGLLLALVSLGVFIYFIHHAAASIQAENVIAGVSRELHQALDRLYPECMGRGAPAEARGRGLPEAFGSEARPVSCRESNYLQAIDVDGLLELARGRDLVLRIVQRPGKFFFQGGDLAEVWPGDRVDDELAEAIRSAFYFGPRRTLTQDVEFAFDQLVEVAVRALSPGVNDPFTAIDCVDRLGGASAPWRGGPSPRPTATIARAACGWSPTPRPSRGSSTPRSTRSARPRAATPRSRSACWRPSPPWPPAPATRGSSPPCASTPTPSIAAAARGWPTPSTGRTPNPAITWPSPPWTSKDKARRPWEASSAWSDPITPSRSSA